MLPSGELVGGHEDVGRHVALDKLLGRRAREGESWLQGAVLVSSRASYEMVQKSAMCGVEILFAVSAATTLAVEVAKRCNLTLVGFCKPQGNGLYPSSAFNSSLKNTAILITGCGFIFLLNNPQHIIQHLNIITVYL